MRPGFAFRLALRESRHGARRVAVYMTSITLGVGALVSIHSFREDVARSVREEADVLMGADALFETNRPFPDSVTTILDSLRDSGAETARVTTALSMVLAPESGDVRLLQVQASESGYPFYGDVHTTPAGMWGRHVGEDAVLVDPAVLTQLRVDIGDTLVVGLSRLELVGTVEDVPTDLGFQTAVGPRVYVSQATMERAGLLSFGSLARYQTFLKLPDRTARERIEERYDSTFQATRVRYTLAEEQADRLGRSVRFLSRFLSLVGLGALLLGGIGVASAIHVYIREKRPGVAVLRCIGADQWTVFTAYLLQAGALGFFGSALGVALGVLLQRTLPALIAGALPVDVTTHFSPTSALAGLGIGVWVAAIFALIPLLQIRDVPPLQALRQDFEPPRRRGDPIRVGAYAALLGSVVLLCVLEAPEARMGLGFAGALAVAVGLLAATGMGLTRLTRRLFPGWASYPVRQGVSNLFRPQNQTVSVTLALGFGAFIVGTLLEVQGNMVDDLTVSFEGEQPNVLLFDVQPDQVDGVRALLPPDVRESLEVTPIVISRIASINGHTPEAWRDAAPEDARPRRGALRREYRNTIRAEVGPAEKVVRGRWWDGTPGSEDGTAVDAGGLGRISLEREIAGDLRVDLGDTITWQVGGAEVPSVVSSIREVEWNRLEPNFFAIFEPGVVDHAPQTIMMVARIEAPEARTDFQRRLVSAFPNVSALDFSRVQVAIDGVLSRVRQAVVLLGLFSAFAGVVVLVGAVASSRVQRMREGALLKTLGARRRQVLVVLFAEYLALGTLATATGLALSAAASAIVVPQVFEMSYGLHAVPLLAIWGSVAGLTVLVGLLGSRNLLARPPLAMLREAPE